MNWFSGSCITATNLTLSWFVKAMQIFVPTRRRLH